MSIFYNKKTGNIIGHIGGRVHDILITEKVNISLSGISDDDIGKYVVPTKPKKTDKKTVELLPDVPFASKILLFESNSSEIYKYRVKLNDKGKVVNILKK